jgi:copper chaperone CopZ
METIKFKTNLKCSGCVERVTPFLNEAVGEKKWEVDLNDPARVVTVAGDSDETRVKEALEKAGYKAEKI